MQKIIIIAALLATISCKPTYTIYPQFPYSMDGTCTVVKKSTPLNTEFVYYYQGLLSQDFTSIPSMLKEGGFSCVRKYTELNDSTFVLKIKGGGKVDEAGLLNYYLFADIFNNKATAPTINEVSFYTMYNQLFEHEGFDWQQDTTYFDKCGRQIVSQSTIVNLPEPMPAEQSTNVWEFTPSNSWVVYEVRKVKLTRVFYLSGQDKVYVSFTRKYVDLF